MKRTTTKTKQGGKAPVTKTAGTKPKASKTGGGSTPSPRRGNPLAVLEVIDRLEVGPVELRGDRLRAPYRVTRHGVVQEMHLVYRYQEKVFVKDDPDSMALASMIAAQVALNYGLFCSEIVLHGPFDAVDRKFLEQMLENTSREIYVKKFLEPNAFLVGPAADLPAEKRERYTQAKLMLPDAVEESAAKPWSTDAERYAVLSSGGKDSLLSYGLLRELGVEIHPIFGNESGRHWHTALNAYRNFLAEVPHSTRVWMNSDRVFSWMLRHLPFVRPDFHSLRSDEYPIRLWTVAVFSFGALPLLRHRGIGSLIIGDEYDTTVQATHKGIAHHDGLFDQSLLFDRALTRYMRAKGWAIDQFSLLRNLSELLIQKTLAERYPDLLALQMSCHATHLDGTRARPCGRCEKCRRIVAMLLAIGQTPGACGYTEEQVDRIRRELTERGVHQEIEAVETLAQMLHEQGILSEPRLGRVKGRRRKEILSLRFHPKRAPVDEMPLSIRSGILGIFDHHAEKALLREGRDWKDADPAGDTRFVAEGPNDVHRAIQPVDFEAVAQPGPTNHRWGELTWPDAKERLKETDIAILPVGAIEQHGPHLPLDTDAYDAEYLAHRVAQSCRTPKPLVLPLVPYGVSYHHDDFPGTLSVRNESLAAFVHDIGMGLARNGIKKLIILNGHGGNGPALHFAAQMINRDAHIFTCVETGETSDPDIEKITETANDVHAGEVETSTTLALRPQLVKMEKAKRFVPRFSSRFLDFTHSHSVVWYARTAKISPSGVLGDPKRATAGKGEAIWKLMVDRLVEFVEHIKDASLAELYEKRY